jgi:alpha-tubulin suppressor-like RCC1 family protein
MTVLRRSRRLARAGGAAILTRSHVAAGWGYNGDGQLGDGTVTSRSGYGDIGVGDDVVQVAAGSGHGLALRSDGTVWAWGSNGAGELGDGTTTSRSTPVRVTGLSGVTQVAACGYFSVALRSDGTVWAWGDNRGGQLGRGTASNHEVTPARVRGLARVTKISAGADFVLALRSDGSVRAWGDNRRGQLGNGTTASSPVPVKVAGLSGVTGIAAGFDASIATRASGISAITSVWTWGSNDRGQLGDGTLTSRSTPERVSGLPVSIAGISAGGGLVGHIGPGGTLAGGGFAAVLGTDGTVWAWGDDSAGQLGNAPSGTPVTRPVNTIGTGSGISQLSAGDFHMLALKPDGTVLAWGANGYGQLGNGSTAPVTGPVQVTGLTGATQVAAGGEFSLAVHVPVPLPIVPDLTGDTTARAGQALQGAGLVLGFVTKVVDKYCDHLGTVMSQNPAAGTAVSPGSAVSVTIGQAPANGCP